ncbi:MAG: hypothetical protein NTX53_09770, partial [candidate division WOR-3 bacterium]|nr:hypothetical protein [candidate division WOR-3 bacterium]
MARAISGLLLFLIVASAQGLSTRYPASSKSRLDWPYAGWAVVKSALEIRQVGDNVHVQLTGPFQPARSKHTSGGVIPAADFRAFWDSLNQLGF